MKDRLSASEMEFMRRIAGCTLLDHKLSEDILEESKFNH
jgi:hypothetical protein